jgi:hypothetical protein
MARMLRMLSSWVVSLTLGLFLLGPSAAEAAQGTPQSLTEVVNEAQSSGVPPKSLNRLLSVGYANQVDPEAMAGFVRTLTEARRLGLPLDPFVSKIEEGMAKRAPAPMIQQVLVKKRDDYVFTKSTLESTLKKQGREQTVTDETLVRMSESLACGVSRAMMHQYMEQAPRTATLGQVAMTLEAAASLKQHNFNQEAVQRITLTGLKEDYFTPGTKDLGRVLAAAKRKGVPEEKIVATALEAIRNREPVMDMASRLGVKGEDLSHGPAVGSGRGHGNRGAEAGGHREGGQGSHDSGGPGSGGPGGGDAGGGHDGGSGGGHGGGGPGGGDSGGGGHGGGDHGGKY